MEWALIYDRGNASVAVAAMAGDISTFRPDDGYEIVTRNNTRKPRTCSMWARYNPAKDRSVT